MKIFNIQRDILKNLMKGKVTIGSEVGNGYVMLSDSYVSFRLLKEEVYLDLDKFREYDFNNILKNENSAIDLNITDELKIYNKDKLQKLIGEDLEIFINSKYLKYFEEPTFKGLGKNKPVLIYEYEELVGILMPIYSK